MSHHQAPSSKRSKITLTRGGSSSRQNQEFDEEQPIGQQFNTTTYSEGYKIRRNLSFPTSRNTIHLRGGKQGDKRVLKCHKVGGSQMNKAIIFQKMKQRGWGKFLEYDFEVNSRLVVWFYRYVKFSWDNDEFDDRHPTCEINCGSEVFSYSCDDLEKDFGLSCEGFDEFGWEKWPEMSNVASFVRVVHYLNERDVDVAKPGVFCNAGKLNGNNRMLFRIIRDVIIPTSSQDQRLSQPEMLFLYLFNHDKPINLPHIIFTHLQRALESKQSSTYPYGGLITFIMRKWKIVVGEDVVETRPATLHSASLLGTLNLASDGNFVWVMDENRARRSNVEGSSARRSNVEASSSRPRRSNAETSIEKELARTRQDNRYMKNKLNAFERFFRLIGEKMGCTRAELDVLNVPRSRRHGKDPIPAPIVQEEEEEDEEEDEDEDEEDEDAGSEDIEDSDDDE